MLKVAIVTPYHDEPIEWLQQCHESVLAQTYPAAHVLVADGKPSAEVERWYAHHIALPHRHRDYGDTAKTIGAVEAIGSRYDAIGFLDADNWLTQKHVQTCVEAAEQNAASFISTNRYLCHMDGQVMGVCGNCDGAAFVDTNAMFFLSGAFDLVYEWNKLPFYAHAICDRIMWARIKASGVRRAHVDRPTVCYRVSQPSIYRQLGVPVPASATHQSEMVGRALRIWAEEGDIPLESFELSATRVEQQPPELSAEFSARRRVS